MDIRLELDPATEARLKARAKAMGVPLEQAAGELLNEALADASAVRGRMSVEDFRRMLDDLRQGSERLPAIPTEHFSRESFYEDRVDGGNAIPRR